MSVGRRHRVWHSFIPAPRVRGSGQFREENPLIPSAVRSLGLFAAWAGPQGVQGVGSRDGQGGRRGDLSRHLWGRRDISAKTNGQGLERGFGRSLIITEESLRTRL